MTLSLSILPWAMLLAWAIIKDSTPVHDSLVSQIFFKSLIVGVMAGGPSLALAIGAWVLRQGATAVGGWRAAAPVVSCGAVVTLPLVFSTLWPVLASIALIYIVDSVTATWLAWMRWGPWGAGATVIFLAAVGNTFYEELALPFG